MKKTISSVIMLVTVALIFCSCNNTGFNESRDITVISREEGSGTRASFVELFDIYSKTTSGKIYDATTDYADITQSSGVMLTSVSTNRYAIGYLSVNALNDSIRAVSIDGVEPTTDNIKNGNYKVARSFNIAVKDELSAVSKDFISYIKSSIGREIIEKSGYVAVLEGDEYVTKKLSGKITVNGSSSVSPIMETLAEEYMKLNSKVKIEINISDSSTGITSAINGNCDIGMSSRTINQSELNKGIKSIEIAKDGIAVIVNKYNTVKNLSSSAVNSIYRGDCLRWIDINEIDV